MNVLLWIVQIGLALHTLAGAAWKFSKTANETMPSLGAIPNSVWLTMSGIEIVCAVALILPAVSAKFAKVAPIGAAIIAIEMIAFCAIHASSGHSGEIGPMLYWLCVMAVCALVIYGRRKSLS